ncbi:response regulator transcription factor [Agromyces aurantiacus]|uniref:Response regulator transcription factor n=1 Tax=Agromyces aurantiacus TaxID=165814 RepID=A0ABV9R3X0_9MICO|nr:response regulator transcription factor [Agromyces aurantiacus]MBM7502958.1 DNA-binding response OmpR family regulator [Agromyces aurantiacus]
MARILVVDDEPEMAALLVRGLSDEGHDVVSVGDGLAALESMTAPHDIAVVDVGLPGMSGFELCRRLRELAPDLGIVLLTARDAVDDRVRGLDSGADDYLTKPFAFAELAARIRALRRRETNGSTRLAVGDLELELARHRIASHAGELGLTPTEFDLLHLLAARAGEVVTRSELLESVWGSADFIDPNVLDQYVSYVRRKLQRVGSAAGIDTVRGVGYRFAGSG